MLQELYHRSLTSPSEAVRYSTRRVVELEASKPRAPHTAAAAAAAANHLTAPLEHGQQQPHVDSLSSASSATSSSISTSSSSVSPAVPSSSSTRSSFPSPSSRLDSSLSHVWVDHERLLAELDAHPSLYTPSAAPSSWACWYHYCCVEDEAGWQRTAQYVLVLDSLNFCFWPLPSYEYSDLASALKRVLLLDPAAFSAQRLAALGEAELQSWLQPLSQQQRKAMQAQAQARLDSGSRREQLPPLVTTVTPPSPFVAIPLLSSRTRALNELGVFLQQRHRGLAYHLVTASHTASALLSELLAHLPSFRDHCVHPTSGMQVYFYKRAMIAIGDLWGAFADVPGLCAWPDVHRLTAFADYRLPQLMLGLGLLQVSDELRGVMERREEVESGSCVEVSLRAHTVWVVEEMQRRMKEKGVAILPLQLDWILWERGESSLDTLPHHHRTRTIYY